MSAPSPPAQVTAPDVPPVLRWAIWAIQQVGFPIAVAGYLLWQVNGTLDRLTQAVVTNQQALQQILERLAR